VKRKIINIDLEKCNGCGVCIPDCPEGAIQMIDGKARLISDMFCDGLGACLKGCPVGAITTIEREAEAYNERKVMENIVLQGANTIRAHLEHLSDHDETEYLNQALDLLKEKGIPIPPYGKDSPAHHEGCPGSRTQSLDSASEDAGDVPTGKIRSELTQWPVQLTLLNPQAPYLKGADLVVAADCAPYACADFHPKYLKGKKLAILCPKLDTSMTAYAEKLKEIFSSQEVRSVTAVRMEVPCCGGVTRLVQDAIAASGKDIPFREEIVPIKG
jgi:NAD-dependent dihydropyrimidine dehydrogenase PreA subunit